jgi:hypothetical protein
VTDLAPSLERELGNAGNTDPFDLNAFEEAVELRWPSSLVVYDRMRRTDGQTASVLRAIGLPIRRTGWHVLGSDVRPVVREFVERQLGLTIDERGRRRRRRQGVSFDEHLRHALLMLPFGHSVFEQVYELGPPPPGLEGLPPVVAHLRKLAPRLPRTIIRWKVARDGGLEAIVQSAPFGAAPTGAAGMPGEVSIPVDRLVAYIHEREGADWTGTSILRASYKNWLIKDQLLRLSAVAADRQSMGLPVVNYDRTTGSRAEALKIVKRARAGEEAGVALPDGYAFALEAVKGQVMDLLPWVRYHDESIGRNALAMFLNLGHDRGARSLGETFAEFFAMALQTLAEALEEVLTEHVVRDLVELNFGPDEPYPAVVADDIRAEGPLTAEALGVLVTAGVILPDDDLEGHVRRTRGLPPAMRVDGGPGGGQVEVVPEVEGPALPAPAAASGPTLAELADRLRRARARQQARDLVRRRQDDAAGDGAQ